MEKNKEFVPQVLKQVVILSCFSYNTTMDKFNKELSKVTWKFGYENEQSSWNSFKSKHARFLKPFIMLCPLFNDAKALMSLSIKFL